MSFCSGGGPRWQVIAPRTGATCPVLEPPLQSLSRCVWDFAVGEEINQKGSQKRRLEYERSRYRPKDALQV